MGRVESLVLASVVLMMVAGLVLFLAGSAQAATNGLDPRNVIHPDRPALSALPSAPMGSAGASLHQR